MNGEQPQYALTQDLKRVLIPKVFQLIGLCAVFYFAVWLNLYLLDAQSRTKSIVTIISLIILGILVIIGSVFSFIKARNKYLFYSNKLEFKGKTIPYVNITNVSFSRNFLDKIFNTGTIVLYPDFKIENIQNADQVFTYVQKLVQSVKQQVVS